MSRNLTAGHKTHTTKTATIMEDKEIQRGIISRSKLRDNGYNPDTLSGEDMETIADALVDYFEVSDCMEDALESIMGDFNIEKEEEETDDDDDDDDK